MDRRKFMTSMAAAVGLPSVSATVGPGLERLATEHQASETRKKRPKNVIVMICDDLGYGDLHCYGSQLPTPNLDRLAARGMLFTHCTSAHPICSAARGALLTGRYAPRSQTLGSISRIQKRE